MLIDPRGAMCVGVVVLADKHDGVLVVPAGRHVAHDSALDDLLQILLPAEKDLNVLMETSAAVVASIYHNPVTQVVFAQDVGIYVTVASVRHGADMHIPEASS